MKVAQKWRPLLRPEWNISYLNFCFFVFSCTINTPNEPDQCLHAAGVYKQQQLEKIMFMQMHKLFSAAEGIGVIANQILFTGHVYLNNNNKTNRSNPIFLSLISYF